MPKLDKENSGEEQFSSDDDSYGDDGTESDEKEENDDRRNYSESDEDKYSDQGSDDPSRGRHSDEEDQGSDDRSRGRYSDEEDDDYSDYESGENSDEFDDEETSKNSARIVVNHRYTEDDDGELKDDAYWWEGKETIIAAILLFCCCLCLIIIGVVLGVVLGRKNRNNDFVEEILPAPTNRPTFAPQPLPPSAFTPSPTESAQPSFAITITPTIRPTARPTTSPTESFAPTKGVPQELDIFADQDTYVHHNVSKEYEGEEYGLLNTILVQRGPLKDELLPDSRGLITFPIEDVPDFSRIEDMEKSATLRLTHVVSADQHPSANYNVIRIPEVVTKVEYFHGFYFVPPEDNATGVKVGPTFTVGPNDAVIDIDISSVLYNYTLEDNKKAKQLFLMIENRGPEQIEGGDRFYSRESDYPPELLLNFNGN